MRYFFHVHDGETILDDEGVTLPDLRAAQRQALQACGDMLREMPSQIWSGTRWRLWVTDQPNGAGDTLLALNITTEL